MRLIPFLLYVLLVFVLIYANVRMRSGRMNSAISVQKYLLLFCWISIFFVIDVFFYIIDAQIFAEAIGVARSQESVFMYSGSSKMGLSYTF